jgi:hypothetical protein
MNREIYVNTINQQQSEICCKHKGESKRKNNVTIKILKMWILNILIKINDIYSKA